MPKSSVVIDLTVSTPSRSRRRPVSEANDVIDLSQEDNNNEVESVGSSRPKRERKITNYFPKSPTGRSSNSSVAKQPKSNKSSQSPTKLHEKNPITQELEENRPQCPICLEDFTDLRKLGKTVASTTCGHLFCLEDLKAAVMKFRKCPTCSKLLKAHDFHPIYM